MMLIMHAF